MIQANNLSKTYNNGVKVLNITNLEIPKGQSFGLVGNNGAGKTTFFSLLLDLIEPTTGSIKNKGIQVNTSEAWKPFTSAFIDESFLIGYLTAEEYFYFIGDLRGQNKADVDALLQKHEEFFNGEILNSKKYLRDLSKGNMKKAGIIAALIGNPEVVILDEPFANLDPTTVNRLKKIIKEIADDPNRTVLVSSHDLVHTVEVCNRIVALHLGEVVKDIQTSPETLKELEAFFAV
ncbi:MAG: ABC transporter ATP-binding protein [Flavobacterium sp.]|nr:ABC transporter ATP-binding protein [Flavobacterium sp.]